MLKTVTRSANCEKKSHAKALRCQGGAALARYRHALAVFVLSATVLAASSAEAQWQPHTIKVGDGQGGQNLVPAQIQSLTFPGAIVGTDFTMPFGLAEMDNGQIALMASKEISGAGTKEPVIAFSSDGGDSWSAFQTTVPGLTNTRPTVFTYLGGSNLSFVASDVRYFSSDYGQTWPTNIPVQQTTFGTGFLGEGNEAVDYDVNGNAAKVMALGWSFIGGNNYPIDDGTGFFRSSIDGGQTWQNEALPPQWKFDAEFGGTTYTRGVSEGSIVRATNGDLVAALRTDMDPYYYAGAGTPTDINEGIAISVSKDDGLTWSPLNRLYTAGRHHGNLQRTPDGALILTMINRADIRTGDTPDTTNIGSDSLISLDNGLTWDVSRRITLDEYTNPNPYPLNNAGHIGAVTLSDGSVISAYGEYPQSATTLVKWNPKTALGPALELHINQFSGSTRIVGVGGGSTDLDGYDIASNTASGVWVPGNWNSITDQNGGTWEEVAPTAPLTQADILSELNQLGFKSISSSSVVALGNIFDTTDTERDISFIYGQDGNASAIPGLVVFDGVGLRLRVNKTTGTIEIINAETVVIDFDAYEIRSTSGELSAAAWNGLEDQTVTGWEEITSSDSLGISELNFTSSSLLAGAGIFDLGAAYAGGNGGTEDLTFAYSIAGGALLSGTIEYIIAGDFDADGNVDGDDLAQWEGDFGLNGDSDANGDGDSDGMDFLAWQRQFGFGVSPLQASSAAVAVPEPAAMVSFLLGAFCISSVVRRKRKS